jgi:hypothetical protein
MATMPWGIDREGSALRVHILAPMEGEWQALMDNLGAHMTPTPLAVYMPSHVTGGTSADADQLTMIWQSLTDLGIPILPPR